MWPLQYLPVHAVQTLAHAEGFSFEDLRKTAAPGVGAAWQKVCAWASQSSFAWLYTEVSRRSSPTSLNISSVGIQDLPRAWAAAQNVNSGGRKRLLAELKMKINLQELEPFEEIKGG